MVVVVDVVWVVVVVEVVDEVVVDDVEAVVVVVEEPEPLPPFPPQLGWMRIAAKRSIALRRDGPISTKWDRFRPGANDFFLDFWRGIFFSSGQNRNSRNFLTLAVIMSILPNILLAIFVFSELRLAAEGVSQGPRLGAGIFPGEGDLYFLCSPKTVMTA